MKEKIVTNSHSKLVKPWMSGIWRETTETERHQLDLGLQYSNQTRTDYEPQQIYV